VTVKKILVLGAYGMLGSSLSRRLIVDGHNVLRQGRKVNAEIRIDPTDGAAMADLLAQHPVDVIVNLIAATNVDQCEVDPLGAYQANVQIVEALTQAILIEGKLAPHLIQISTDQVYFGLGPHIEAKIAPCNVYGLSKLAGELIASKVGATVIRTNFFGRSQCVGRTSLTDWIVTSLRTGQQIIVFDDVLFNALHIDTLCTAIEIAVHTPKSGTFNVGSRDGCSKAHLALGLAKQLGLNRDLLILGSVQDMKFRARRQLDMRMDTTHFEQTFRFTAPTFESQIGLTAQEYLHE
jgi:dTDP-4-dehydrorhamnose reductase